MCLDIYDMAKSTNSPKPVFAIISAILLIVIVLLAVRLYSVMKDQKEMENQIASAQTIPLPANAVKITECIPYEGEHWVEADKVTNGPYYVTYQGKVVSVEYMLAPNQIPGEKTAKSSPEDFMKYVAANNKTLADIVDDSRIALTLPVTTYKTVHIGWTAPHAGFLIPHYDIHFDLLTDAELHKICPDARLQDVYSPEVLKGINKNNIPFPGQ